MADSKVPDTKDKVSTTVSSADEVSDFLAKVAATPAPTVKGARGRLLFAMDATASRQPTWDKAASLQVEMFNATRAIGGLDVQLAFFRGFGEFKVTPWLNDAGRLRELMTRVFCAAGETQIEKVLRHTANEARKGSVNALVYVGDCCEEDVDRLGKAAGELGLLGVPAFMFHEGGDAVAGYAFQQIARLTGGAYCAFDGASAETLKQLLGAVAVFAAGGA